MSKLLYLIPSILFIIVLVVILDVYSPYKRRAMEKARKEVPVSLPEEISEAKKGDTLYVIGVSDSIYVGFRKY